MQLSLIHLPSRTFLLLVVSNLFLWDNVASVPTSTTGDGSFQVSLKDLFEQALDFSQNIIDLSSDIYNDYVERSAEGRSLIERPFSQCPTSFLPTFSRRQAIKSQPEVLLKRILSILGTWINPLEYVLTEDYDVKQAPEVREIMQKMALLQQDIKMILRKIHLGVEEDNYTAWTGPMFLQVDDEESRIFAFFDLFRCLQKESYTIDAYIRMAKCRVFVNDNC